MQNVRIPGTNVSIGPGEPVFTIAEIGKGFIQSQDQRPVEEYLDNAKRLVDAAAAAGATSVKFQTHFVEDEQLPLTVNSPHFTSMTRYEWVKRNTEATPVWFWKELKSYVESRGLIFFSAPMSRGAARRLEEEVGVSLWKIGSADILDFLLLDYVCSTGKPIIISSGMSTLAETDRAVEFLKRRNSQFVLMHCVSVYPCPPERLNLGTVPFLIDRYDVPVGFSSHSTEWQSSVAAISLGAVALEKHFTFDRGLWGSDHKVSLLPNEFAEMTAAIRVGTKIDPTNYGVNGKFLNEMEEEYRPLFRKGLVAANDLPAGTILTAENIYAMRPQVHIHGLTSDQVEAALGRTLRRPLVKYEPLTLEVVS